MVAWLMGATVLEPRRRAAHPLLALTLAGLLVRVAFLLLEPATQPVADERTWTNWAVEALVTPRVHFSPFRTHMIFYPPLYPYFIAVPFALFGTLTAVKWTQVFVGSLLVPALGRVGERAFGARAGLAAAAIAAFYPELVWFSVHFWAETLFTVLLWWGFERLLAADVSDGPAAGGASNAIGAGILWGLAILTRETPLYFLPIAALWLAWRRSGSRAPVGRAAAFALSALLVVAPWTYRNWVVFKAFVPVSTAGGLNLYQGNAPLSREEVYERYEAVQGRIEQYRFARREGLAAIWQRQPWWIFEKLRDEMPNFWEADSQALIHMKRGAYGPVAPATAIAWAIVVLAPYLLVLGLFVAAVVRLRLTRARALLLAFLAYYTLLHVATHGYARYRLPALPVVFLMAGWAWTSRGQASPDAVVPGYGRKALGAVLAVALAASVAPSIRIQAQEPVFWSGI
jgi:hypothetical protein